ncbi:MAG: heat-inducible transcriptional repressor HrcA [Candidatus Omnitrophica bacterium]|nr:heat-inducible transcriptional repressor HrcA [Candidatus Omnitrophota bacterium]MBU1128007.1 heat-inducible transcriptional repressor HrcA [Candidatus Omnitrophota bacterium]MBU1784182.1 heat-inducible transcriptional repressor HrcA [Candidatus Omnitrophota bacterium]MBU1850890.1 heat-inducible transcriptional repressor HrcA [Candidatus Omnitrophota bacterium]
MVISKRKEERNHKVLAHIVRIYVSTGIPVSSKSVAADMGGSISSATIRNIMAELEETGDIVQPHTSAGRVPTDRGYRHYVNLLNKELHMRKREARRLSGEYSERIRSIKDVIERTSALISRELHHASVVMWPDAGNFYLKHLELIKVKSETVLAVLVTMTNAVRNYMIQLDQDLEKTDLQRIANYINLNYEDEKVSDIADYLKNSIEDSENMESMNITDHAARIIDHFINKGIESEISWEGVSDLSGESGYRDTDTIGRILQILSNRKAIAHLMREELPYRGIRTYIGEENKFTVLKRCSIVTSGYMLHGKAIGRIGVVGPTRMNYDSVLRTVSYLSNVVGMQLEALGQ